eukprot:14726409-Alexandrium_andersonii.AAC.1
MLHQLLVTGSQAGLLIESAHMERAATADAHNLRPDGLAGRGLGRPLGNVQKLSGFGDREKQAT